MIYQVLISKRAETDMRRIYAYIADELHAPQSAVNQLHEIRRQIKELQQMPKKYALVSDERLAQQGIRKLPVNNYLVFYRVDERKHTVIVARVIYGAREWTHLL
jgi:addiction module RelE/StbE family toxin